VEGSGLIRQEIAFVFLLSLAALVAIITRRIRLPYTVALVLVGLALAFLPDFLGLNVSSELILAVLIPPLIFEATLQIKWPILRRDFSLVLALAIGGTLLSTLVVGGIVYQVLDIPLLGALVFGALISATDPVAVIAFFRSLGVSKRLSILVEGESLFNDGVAIVLFNMALGAAVVSGNSAEAGLNLSNAILEFLRVSLGGLGVGFVLGLVVSYVILKNVDDHLIETATTLALAFGAYVTAEQFHVSGILAVVAAGLIVGNLGSQNTSPSTSLAIDNFWELLAFVANSLVFLLIGIRIELGQRLEYFIPIVVAVLAVLLSRAITVYVLAGFHGRLVADYAKVPTAYRHVMFWGGLRGAISLALVLTIGRNLFGASIAEELQTMTFGVVLFTILVQGTTIETLIRRLGLARRPPQSIEQQRRQTLVYAKRAGQRELERLRREGIVFREIWEAMSDVYEEELETLKERLRDHLETYPELEQELYLQVRADVLRAERSAITDAARRGFISEEVHTELASEADRRMAALELVMQTVGIKTGGTSEQE
jgi:CPA1 family monovalent cation:H+ antiporter